MASQSPIDYELKFEESYRAFELGFLEGSNPRVYNRILGMASLNAVRTMVKPMKSAAPRDTSRLSNSVSGKSGRYNRPSATVGPRPGKSRAGGGAWYRYFVTSGHKTRGAAQGVTKAISWGDIGKGVAAPKGGTGGGGRVQGRPFVHQISSNEGYLQTAMDAYYATMEKFFNDSVFRHKLTKFKRRGK